MPADPDATRRRIVAAARGEFSERGLEGARVRAIAAAARVNAERLYGHFGSKERLFAVTVEEAVAELAAACTDHDSATAWFAASTEHLEAARLVIRGELDIDPAVVLRLAGGDNERAARIGLALAWVVFPGMRDSVIYRQALSIQ